MFFPRPREAAATEHVRPQTRLCARSHAATTPTQQQTKREEAIPKSPPYAIMYASMFVVYSFFWIVGSLSHYSLALFFGLALYPRRRSHLLALSSTFPLAPESPLRRQTTKQKSKTLRSMPTPLPSLPIPTPSSAARPRPTAPTTDQRRARFRKEKKGGGQQLALRLRGIGEGA